MKYEGVHKNAPPRTHKTFTQIELCSRQSPVADTKAKCGERIERVKASERDRHWHGVRGSLTPTQPRPLQALCDFGKCNCNLLKFVSRHKTRHKRPQLLCTTELCTPLPYCSFPNKKKKVVAGKVEFGSRFLSRFCCPRSEVRRLPLTLSFHSVFHLVLVC